MITDAYWFHSQFGETAMRKQIETGIFAALLAGVILAPAHAQKASKSTGNTQTNGTDGQRKSGQVVHQDFSKVQASKPAATPANQGTTQGATSSNSGGNSAEKEKFRQEFAPMQASKKNDAIEPSGSGGQGGKPKTAGAKTQSPK